MSSQLVYAGGDAPPPSEHSTVANIGTDAPLLDSTTTTHVLNTSTAARIYRRPMTQGGGDEMATPAAARSPSTEDLSAVADASLPVIAVGDTDIRASSVCNGDVQAKSPDSPATAAQPSQPLVPLSTLILPLYLPHLLMSIGKEFVAPVLPLFARDELSSSDTVVGVALAAAGIPDAEA